MNPYPFYEDRWNRLLVVMAAANVLALILGIFFSEAVDFSRLSEPSWVPGLGGLFLLFLFGICIVATLTLWVSMFVYWARAGRPLLWLFLLLVGAWGSAIAFLFLVYRRDLETYKKHEEEERQSLNRLEVSK